MDVGLNIAASAMAAEQVREDQLSNDLANASTPGYKPDQAEQSAFGAMLLTSGQGGPALGTIDTGVQIGKQVADLAQGSLQSTGEPLDFAISGQGFFAVRTSAGVRYTRDGQFTASASGQLTDPSGDPVLNQSGAPVTVSSNGTVDASALGVFSVANPVKQGDDLFSGSAGGRASGTVLSGELESSGVDPAQTIVQMMTALNDYQSDENAVQTINQVDQRSSTSVGSLNGS
jgi:flagellar basal-body rod protein FlgG